MADDQMIVNDIGLLNINKKIADIRKYDKNLISTEGSIVTVDGVAKNFSQESYLYKSELNLSGEELTYISFWIFLYC